MYTVVYMARDVMILSGANSFRGRLEEVSPENRDSFEPENGNERSEFHLGSKTVDFSTYTYTVHTNTIAVILWKFLIAVAQ